MPKDYEKEVEVEINFERPVASQIGSDDIIKRTYSPIGLSFDSTDMGEPGEEPIVNSVKILRTKPGDPIPECEGYELVCFVPNATLTESPGDIPVNLGGFTDVYVFVKKYAAELA
jgi:hypothetical protein